MELNIPNKVTDKPFELKFSPMALDIYFERFHRDMIADITEQMQVYGAFPRSLTIRIVWVLCVNANPNFFEFVEFVEMLEYNLHDFAHGWGKEFTSWFIPFIDNDLTQHATR